MIYFLNKFSFVISMILIILVYLIYAYTISPKIFNIRLHNTKGESIKLYKLVRKYRYNPRLKDSAILGELALYLQWRKFDRIKEIYNKINIKNLKDNSAELYSKAIILLYLVNQVDLAILMANKFKKTNHCTIPLISAINDYYLKDFVKSKSELLGLKYCENITNVDFFNASIAYYLGMMSDKSESISYFEMAKSLDNTEISKKAEEMISKIKESSEDNA